MIDLRYSSRLAAPQPEVWNHATSAEGVNYELKPLARMTFPKDIRSLEDLQFTAGEPIFRSWVFLFGILPFDFSNFTLESLDAGGSFVEKSTMGSMRKWQHSRIVAAEGPGCCVTDMLEFEPRLPSFVVRPFVDMLFKHRHQRLIQRFGRGE